jgi:Domain of unknown function (DUF4192)
MTRTTTLTARSPEDLLALVPIVLGFVPHDSVVMLTFGAERTFHARVDLPTGDADVGEVVQALLEPARRHLVRRVVFVLYAADDRAARTVARPLLRAFEEAGVEVIDLLRAHGNRWFTVLGRRRGVPTWGVPYDVSAHPFAAEAVLDGRVTHGSREELAASLRTDPDRVAAVATALAARAGRADPGPGRTPAEMVWARRLVMQHAAAGTAPDDADLARLLVGMHDPLVRDAAWMAMTRDSSREHVGLWTDVVRRSPREVLAAPAALLGFAAWLSGQGALAWCAIDRCRESVPDYGLAGLLAEMLVHAVPPSAWEERDSADEPP